MKNRVRLVTLFLFLLIAIGASLAILNIERQKRLVKYLADKAYYDEQYNNWNKYKQDYQNQVANLVKSNKEQMQLTKTQYEKLLAEQPDLIKQHTRLSLDSSQVVATSNAGGAVVTTKTNTQTIKVAKPASKPKTSSS